MAHRLRNELMAEAQKKTDVALVKDDVPDYLSNARPVSGEDNFDQSDVVIPRIKLLQGLSGEVEQFNEAKAGLFWHTGFDMPLGEEFQFVVADRRKKYLLVAPLADGQGILARSDDAGVWDRTGEWQVKIKGVKNPVTWEIDTKDVLKSKVTKWGSSNPGDDDSPPAATMFYDYLVYCPAYPEIGMSIISLARSQIRKAKKGLNDKIALQRTNGRPMQSLIFNAKSVEEHGEEGPYKNWQFSAAGFVPDKDTYEWLRGYRGALANVIIAGEADLDEDKPEGDDGEGAF